MPIELNSSPDDPINWNLITTRLFLILMPRSHLPLGGGSSPRQLPLLDGGGFLDRDS